MDGKIALEEHYATGGLVDTAENFLPGAKWPDLRARLLDIHDMRLGEMDRHGIEMTLLSLNAPGVQAIPDTAEAIEVARTANDELAESLAKRPDRFRGFAALPMQDPEAAASELTHAVRELGFVGALVNGYTEKDEAGTAVYFDGHEYRPFWATVQELEAPLYLHPRSPVPFLATPYAGQPWLMGPAWAFAVETAVHAMRLMGSQLFDEYPGVQIVLGHLGERIPYDMARIDQRIEWSPFGYPCKKPISAYMRENFHITTSGNFNDPTFHCAIAEMGVARLMFSVDYPFEQTEEGAQWFDNTELSDADRLSIGRQNAIDLFKLKLE